MNFLKSWKGRMDNLQLKISTGPVVAYRTSSVLLNSPMSRVHKTCPLFQLHNVDKLQIKWPIKEVTKPQFIKVTNQTKTILVPNKNYLFIRRFSTKDEKARLVAAPHFSSNHQNELIGIENHLNYIYKATGELSKNELLGLTLLFNSKLYNIYFQTFNGSTNVSASELREIPLPNMSDIIKLGAQVKKLSDLYLRGADFYVDKYFKLDSLLYQKKKFKSIRSTTLAANPT